MGWPHGYHPKATFMETPMSRPISYVLGLFGLITLLAACETIEGAGQDLENAGEVIQEESNDTQADM